MQWLKKALIAYTGHVSVQVQPVVQRFMCCPGQRPLRDQAYYWSAEGPGKSAVRSQRLSHRLCPSVSAPEFAAVRDEHGVVHDLRSSDCSQTTAGRRILSTASHGPSQKTETYIQAQRLRFRGRITVLFIPGSGRCVLSAFSGRWNSLRTAFQLVPSVRRHRIQDPERERSAVSSL